MIETIKRKLQEINSESDSLYLLSKLSEDTGFFFLKGQVLLLTSNVNEKNNTTRDTEKLTLSTRVYIEAVENDHTFSNGYYDYVLFKGTSEESDFDMFIKICCLYINSVETVSLKEFFYTILEMFQMPGEQQYKNLIGLYGELCVLKNLYEAKGKNMSRYWHNNSSDKNDYVGEDLIIEVKTTMSKLLEVKLKHDQLFSKDGIILAVVQLDEDNGGCSLTELITTITGYEEFKNDFIFQVKLAKEMKRISPVEADDRHFTLLQIKYYNNMDIPTISDIPDGMSCISYNYALAFVNDIDIDNFLVEEVL